MSVARLPDPAHDPAQTGGVVGVDLIETFCREYHTLNSISAARATEQRRNLRKFEVWIAKPILDADANDLRSFLTYLMDNGRGASTVAKWLHQIRPFFKWAWQAGLYDSERMMRMRDVKAPRHAKPLPRPYSRQELGRMWAQLDQRWPLIRPNRLNARLRGYESGRMKWRVLHRHAWRLQLEAVIAIALYGGLRRNEIFRLTLEEMHPDNDVIVAWSRKNKAGQSVSRAVPMFEPMSTAIGDWLDFRAWLKPDHDRPWLVLYKGRKLGVVEYVPQQPISHTRFSNLMNKLGPGEWTFHRFRHTCATELLRADMPLEKVQRILGHTDIHDTLLYTQLLDGDVIDAAAKAENKYVKALGRLRTDDRS